VRFKKRISRGILLKAPWEIDRIRAADQVVAEVLQALKEAACPGISTLDLDRLAYDGILARGAKPAFLGYRGYPATACISINSEVVHGIPSKDRVIEEGDLVSLDLGAIYKDYVGDAALSFVVGDGPDIAKRLVSITEKALYLGIEQARPRKRLQDISWAIQSFVEGMGFQVVRKFVGHGVGRNLHEPPEIPNFGSPGQGPMLRPGMVLAIEPMVTEGTSDVVILKDGWTAVTADGKLSAHFEHSIAIWPDGPEILSKI